MVSATSLTLDQCYDFDVALPMMRSLCGRTRVEILNILADGPADVHSIADRLSLDIKAVSQQLQAMRAVRLVEYETVWRCHSYQLSEIVRVRQHPRMLEVRISPMPNCAVVVRLPRRPVVGGGFQARRRRASARR